MATIPSKMAVPPLPRMGERHEPPPAVEVVEQYRPGEGMVIMIRTRNTT